jgi:pyruvate kinase
MKISKLTTDLETILKSLENSEHEINAIIKDIPSEYYLSAKNLLRYLIIRTFDLRKYHDHLSDLGISSLRTSEGYVYSNLYNVVRNLKMLQGAPPSVRSKLEGPLIELVGYKKSKKLLKKNTNKLFKRNQKKHFAEIMVTLPEHAATDKSVIHQMADCGMEIARINLSHGDLASWKNMVTYIDEINHKTHHNIKIYMDLSGPKFRTSNIEIRKDNGKMKDKINIQKGEHIILTKRKTTGKSSVFNAKNMQLEKAEIGVLLHEIIDAIKVGDAVFFDDGMIKAVAVAKTHEDIELEITDCYKASISSQKGINLPHSNYVLPALTDMDIEYLPFICRYADIVGYSFVRTKEDVQFLYNELDKLNNDDLGIVFKIENTEAFENLPRILLEGMKRQRIGVMIARGDLAVEVGFERISEVQNQILWICEAAHIPVIWATQVLENLAKTGVPTRAEISDATLGAHAECIMLNKGPFINNAIKTLEGILVRMESHGFKRKNSMRSLSIAEKAVADLMETQTSLI